MVDPRSWTRDLQHAVFLQDTRPDVGPSKSFLVDPGTLLAERQPTEITYRVDVPFRFDNVYTCIPLSVLHVLG